MAFQDVLLVLITYPQATDPAQIETAVAFAAHAKARLSAAACVIKARGEPLSEAFIDVPARAEAKVAQSAKADTELMAGFELLARTAGVYGDSLIHTYSASEAPDWLARQARLRDLTIVPAASDGDTYRWYAEAIMFGSGRPVLILPPRTAPEFAPHRIVVAWDGSRAASRAVADALPLLERAKEVQVLTVLKEKALGSTSLADELAESLKRRGIVARPDCLDAAGRTIGEVLIADLATRQADLLVMGAYGHSRLREFILGGATRSMLANPPLPLLVSH
jgi:nucleotide-binding universal stress UspA family protein